jgi:hypothetical protein
LKSTKEEKYVEHVFTTLEILRVRKQEFKREEVNSLSKAYNEKWVPKIGNPFLLTNVHNCC